jgi:hypothetical protein
MTRRTRHTSRTTAATDRGRLAGQLRLRVRFRELSGPWFDYLFAAKEEMTELVGGTGWTIARLLEDEGPSYCAVLEKEPSSESTSQSRTAAAPGSAAQR